LVPLLKRFGPELSKTDRTVLFPTNDLMVREIGGSWDELSRWYDVSWSRSVNQVLAIQRKDNLPKLAADIGVLHPATAVVAGPGLAGCLDADIAFPVLLKPAVPLSSFKTLLVANEIEMAGALDRYADSLPFIAQQWIGGPDTSLYFYSGFWRDGVEIACYTGYKRRSLPPCMGQGVVMEGGHFPEVLELGRKVAASLAIDGPIAVEFKRDDAGNYWMIEPNIGRTEYCIDLLIQSGINIPLIEYLSCAGAELPSSVQARRFCAWFDTERSPLCYAQDRLSRLFHGGTVPSPVFPYFGHGDLRPLVASIVSRGRTIPRSIASRLGKLLLPNALKQHRAAKAGD
jgi:D-aspartate ligase